MSCICVSLADLEVKLKDGAHRCEGRVEVKYQGEWGTMNDHSWRRQLWCADSWSVELPLMLPEELILDLGLAPFGFIILTAMGKS